MTVGLERGNGRFDPMHLARHHGGHLTRGRYLLA